jgi:rhamnosyltransferase
MSTSLIAPSQYNICAVVVCYHPESSITEKIIDLAKQVDKVIIVDNCSDKLERATLVRSSQQSEKVTMILNKENIGQAKALNMGVNQARDWNYSWVLTMDQDSLVAPDMVSNMSAAYHQCDQRESVMSICPALSNYDGITPPTLEKMRLRSFSGKKIEGFYSYTKIVITSGNLVSIYAFDQVGLFEENFFIDYVDQEFSLRLFRAGYKAIQANTAILYHNMGNTTKQSFLGKELLITNNSSLRTYYFYRNGIAVYKKYFFSDFPWVLQNFIKGFIFYMVKIIMFESNRKDKINKAWIGIIHGFIGKMGKYEPPV